MNYEVISTPEFRRLFKKLAKRYPSLKSDLQQLINLLRVKPDTGISLGHRIYKIRLSISSKAKGKSGGARVITFLITEEREVYLVHIYDKSQLENISKKKILELLKETGLIG